MKHIGLTLLTILVMGTGVYGDDIDYMAEAITGFQLEKYLGTWYEIARMDHSFERGMSHVTASYSLKADGGVNVINRGYVKEKSKWKSANGSAHFKTTPNVGALRVTFFWPFYGGYHIVLLAEDYSYALVAGDSEKYLWILSRTPEITEDVWQLLIHRASLLGYSTSDLIIVDHDPIVGQP